MDFKHCPACGHRWPTRNDLLSDPEVELVGYQPNFKALASGIILFNHSCKGTLGIFAVDFEDLYDGPIFQERQTDSPNCSGHCLHQGNLKPCLQQCECAYIREIIQTLKTWPKCGHDAAGNTA